MNKPHPVASLSLSVIVPLAPGETEWQGLLQQLTSLPAGSEVIVVRADDESWPAPAGWPMRLRYRECHCKPGRARQLNLGARLATGHWLWFLHADSRLRPDSLRELQRFLAEGIDALGWFQLAFRKDGPPWTVLNAAGANLRSRWLGLPFGDQGLVLPRHCFEALHGFNEEARYGEDHLLVWAAHHAALPLRRIPALLETSARKYAQQGWLTTTLGHWQRTTAQAWPAWRARRRARP
ncbi:TIGR04283 family arsenosugar biosynthesis glycosyltransferase [Castellaniella sp.]|uniref:TIGR04283 family arsenosugar biosynthesis glycosyltransferase n=1 Tax=Castellaniella sp. TaxID=1955812 RepID=UPI0025B8CC9C|nr:TIGR04283 family arsenosugar biosynthesis glycosyltransferase [Castellaniella sp.]